MRFKHDDQDKRSSGCQVRQEDDMLRIPQTAARQGSVTSGDGGHPLCVNRTPTRTTRLCTYSASQNAVHKYSHSPREHAWLKGQHGSGLRIVVSPKRFRHPSVMSHTLPHVSLNTSTRSLAPTSPIFAPSSPSLSCPLELDQETLRDSRWSGGSAKSASPAFCVIKENGAGQVSSFRPQQRRPAESQTSATVRQDQGPMIAQDKAGGNSVQVPEMEHPCRGKLSAP